MPAEDQTASPQCKIIDAVMSDLLGRQAVGIQTYGVTLSDAPVDLLGWLQHTYEEVLDQACYLRAAIEKLNLQQEKSDG